MSEQDKQQTKVAQDVRTELPLYGQVDSNKACPCCNQVNQDDARFCGECGTDLISGGVCHSCEANILPGSDICESCGAWVRIGQCKFCYAPVADTDHFCSECANPTPGISCPGCGMLSIYDYCPRCVIPLSTQAKKMKKEQANDPNIVELAEIASKLSELEDKHANVYDEDSSRKSSSTIASEEDELRKLAHYREAVARSEPVTPGVTSRKLFANKDGAQIRKFDSLMSDEQKRRLGDLEIQRLEEEARQGEQEKAMQELLGRAKKKLSKLMRKHDSRQFATNQEARRFYMSLFVNLPQKIVKELEKSVKTKKGWKCHLAGVTHRDPSECAVAYGGGEWIF